MTWWQIGRQFDFRTPINSASDLDQWFRSSNSDYVLTGPDYAYRHIATTYNCDRIIDSNDGSKMFNINLAKRNDVISLRDQIREALEPNESYDANQIAVNLINYIDTDSNIVYFQAPDTLTDYFGFSRPCVYISQIAENFYQLGGQGNPVVRYYAIELFKPYLQDDAPNGWKLDIGGQLITISNWSASQHFHVLVNDPQADIPIDTSDSTTQVVIGLNFIPGSNIKLRRNVIGYTFGDTPVDSASVPAASGDWMADMSSSAPHSFERDINPHRCIRKVWNPNMTNSPTLGRMNSYDSSSATIQAHPPGKPFINIGEIGQIFRANAYLTSPDDTEAGVRLNIADPCVQNIFKYLTVMDPYDHGRPSTETRIKGRININTAPWFVLAQLPWLSYHTPNYELARSIISYRDKSNIAGVFDYSGRAGSPGFKSIGELMEVINLSNDSSSMSYYQGKSNTIPIPAILATPTDGAGDAFEERDVIFDRISNLVTVRSDVFTAYILVRIGPSGPQKRVIAIFDRSGVVPDKTSPAGYAGKVKIVAIQQVPDPR